MHLTTFFTLLAAGCGAVAQDTTTTSAEVSATPAPIKEPGTSFSCQQSTTDSRDAGDQKGICEAAGGKFTNVFVGCCIDTAVSGVEASYTQGCSDNGGTVRKSTVTCDLAA